MIPQVSFTEFLMRVEHVMNEYVGRVLLTPTGSKDMDIRMLRDVSPVFNTSRDTSSFLHFFKQRADFFKEMMQRLDTEPKNTHPDYTFHVQMMTVFIYCCQSIASVVHKDPLQVQLLPALKACVPMTQNHGLRGTLCEMVHAILVSYVQELTDIQHGNAALAVLVRLETFWCIFYQFSERLFVVYSVLKLLSRPMFHKSDVTCRQILKIVQVVLLVDQDISQNALALLTRVLFTIPDPKVICACCDEILLCYLHTGRDDLLELVSRKKLFRHFTLSVYGHVLQNAHDCLNTYTTVIFPDCAVCVNSLSGPTWPASRAALMQSSVYFEQFITQNYGLGCYQVTIPESQVAAFSVLILFMMNQERFPLIPQTHLTVKLLTNFVRLVHTFGVRRGLRVADFHLARLVSSSHLDEIVTFLHECRDRIVLPLTQKVCNVFLKCGNQ